ncbi:MAG: hypothetical protein ACLFQL_05065 [Paracoccaceae bacterium]
MDWNDIRRNWPAFIPAIAERWPEAREADLTALDGTREQVIDYIARVTGMSPRDAAAEVVDWQMGEMPADIAMDPLRDNTNIAASARHLPEGEDPSDDDAAFGDDDTPDPPMGRS